MQKTKLIREVCQLHTALLCNEKAQIQGPPSQLNKPQQQQQQTKSTSIFTRFYYIPETAVTSSQTEHLICPCKMFGRTLGWPQQYTPAKGPCFLFPISLISTRYFWQQTPTYPPLNQFNYPQEDKDHNASRLHYYSSFEISLPCTSMHLKSYCRGGCIWRHLHSM